MLSDISKVYIEYNPYVSYATKRAYKFRSKVEKREDTERSEAYFIYRSMGSLPYIERQRDGRVRSTYVKYSMYSRDSCFTENLAAKGDIDAEIPSGILMDHFTTRLYSVHGCIHT